MSLMIPLYVLIMLMEICGEKSVSFDIFDRIDEVISVRFSPKVYFKILTIKRDVSRSLF